MKIGNQARKIFAFLILLMIILFVVYFRENIVNIVNKPERLKNYILSYKELAIPAYLILSTVRSLLFLPAGGFAIVSGITFGTAFGTLLTCLGVSLSGVLSFYISKFAGREFVSGLLKGRLKFIDDKLKNSGIFYIAFLRMLPIVPFDAVSYAAGLTNLGFWNFFIGTFLGSLPGAFTYTYLGTSLNDVHSKDFIYSITLVVLSSILPLLYKYFNEKGGSYGYKGTNRKNK